MTRFFWRVLAALNLLGFAIHLDRFIRTGEIIWLAVFSTILGSTLTYFALRAEALKRERQSVRSKE